MQPTQFTSGKNTITSSKTPLIQRAIFLSATLCVFGCVRANIQIVDQRTALENQIIGSYEELSKDLQLLSSVRAVEQDANHPAQQALSKIRTQALRARQVQQFIQDDVDSLKAAGCLGESMDAMIRPRPCELSSDPRKARLIVRVTNLENSARKTLMDFIIATSPNLTSDDRKALANTWASMRIQRAKAGQWVQGPDGKWKKKP